MKHIVTLDTRNMVQSAKDGGSNQSCEHKD